MAIYGVEGGGGGQSVSKEGGSFKLPAHYGQNATTILLQNATKVYYKIRYVFMTNCDIFIIKCDSCYKT